MKSRDIWCLRCKRNLPNVRLLGKIIAKISHFNTGICSLSVDAAQRKTLPQVFKIVINIRNLKGESIVKQQRQQ